MPSRFFVQIVPLSSIIIAPNRQRRTFVQATIDELVSSIMSKGLFHPPVVRPLDDGKYQLVCGERRLRAINIIQKPTINDCFGDGFFCNGQEIRNGMVPITLVGDLDPLALREAELEENILREDLPWLERCAAVDELAKLRVEQGKTVSDAAKELAKTTGMADSTSRIEVARSRLVAQHLDDRKVQSARTLKEAHSIVTRKLEAEFKADLVDAMKATTEHSLIKDNCVVTLYNLPADTFTCILTDPPYGMGADSFGDAGAAHTYEDDRDTALAIYTSIFLDGFRITKAQAHLYTFCDIDMFETLKDCAARIGWKVFRTPLIWSKLGTRGHDPWPGIGFRRSYELILYAVKGNKPSSVLVNDLINDHPKSEAIHPAAKPVGLYEYLLRRSCIPGDQVIDPCCGTGTIFAAANRLKLRATGIESDADFYTLSKARMYERD